MANVKYIESGTSATQDFTFYDIGVITDGTNGTVTSSSQAVKSSVRSILAATNSGGNGTYCVAGASTFSGANILADAGTRISFYFRFHGTPTLPGGGAAADFLAVNTSSDTAVFGVSLTTGLKIAIVTDGSVALATGSTVLSADTDYRITVQYVITSTTNFTINVYLNGTLEVTATYSGTALPNTGSNHLYFGWGAYISPGSGMSAYYAHIYIDNGTSGDPGDVRVTAKRPNANGTANGFTTRIGSGGSGYGTGHSPQVNERPASATNGWSLSNTTKTTEEYNIENVSTGDNDMTGATIVDYVGWIESSVNSTSNSPVHHIIVNGVATAITESTSQKTFTHIAGSTTYPAGTGTDIGMDAQYTTTAHLTSLFEAGIMIAYIPAAGGTTAVKMQAVKGWSWPI